MNGRLFLCSFKIIVVYVCQSSIFLMEMTDYAIYMAKIVVVSFACICRNYSYNLQNVVSLKETHFGSSPHQLIWVMR